MANHQDLELSKETPSPETINRLLDIQTEELKVKQEEIVLKRQSDQHQYEYAKASLDLQGKDWQDLRRHRQLLITQILRFCTLIVVVIFSFFAYALYLGKDTLVTEIIKALLYAGVSGTGGYYFGKNKSESHFKHSREDE